MRHKFINLGEIPMETVFFSSFLDTVAATHDEIRFQSDFCRSSFLLFVLHMCELIMIV